MSDGYSIDARKEILPGVIKANGIQVGEGVAWDLIHSFLTECSIRAATTGETVTVGSLLSFGLAIKGWFANKDSKASKENVRVTATLLNDLMPTVVFSMSNEIDGVTLTREITLTVHGRCGDADAGTQVKSITAVLDKSDAPTGPMVAYAYSAGHEDDRTHIPAT